MSKGGISSPATHRALLTTLRLGCASGAQKVVLFSNMVGNAYHSSCRSERDRLPEEAPVPGPMACIFSLTTFVFTNDLSSPSRVDGLMFLDVMYKHCTVITTLEPL